MVLKKDTKSGQDGNDTNWKEYIERVERRHFMARSVFSITLIGLLVYFTNYKGKLGKREILAFSECLRDSTFVWTEKVNAWFRSN